MVERGNVVDAGITGRGLLIGLPVVLVSLPSRCARGGGSNGELERVC